MCSGRQTICRITGGIPAQKSILRPFHADVHQLRRMNIRKLEFLEVTLIAENKNKKEGVNDNFLVSSGRTP